MSRPNLAVRSRRYCASLFFFSLAFAMLPPPGPQHAHAAFDCLPLAQFDFDELSFENEDQAAKGLFSLDSLLVKILLILFALILSTGFCLAVIFPKLLTKRKPCWPRTAYGYCLAIVVMATFATAAVMLRNDLGLNAPDDASWFSKWGGFTILGVVWLVCVLLALSIRSSQRE